MAHGTRLNSGSGGDLVCNYDLDATETPSYSPHGKVQSTTIYVSPNLSTAPSPVTPANPLPVSVVPGTPSPTTYQVFRLTDGTNFYDATGGGGGGGTVEVSNFPATQTVNGTVAVSNTGFAVTGEVEVKNDSGNPIPVSGSVGLVPSTAGGLGVGLVLSANTINATVIKNAPGQLYGYACFNQNQDNWRFVKVYDKATAPNPAADTPVLVISMPPNAGANIAFPLGVQFANGIGVVIVAGSANTDTTPPAAGEVVANLIFK